MTPGRMRRLAALTMIGLAFSACADGDRSDKADAPQTGQASSTGGSPDSSQPAAGTSGEGRADFGLADVAAALGVTTPSTPGGTLAAPGGDPSVTGGAPAAGAPLAPDLSPAGATTGGAAAPTQSGAADTGSALGGGSSGAPSGGSGSARPKIHATPEECAMLRQLMAIVDHPQLHQLRADTGC